MRIELETELSQELIAEGRARDLVRKIQLKRKELGCELTEKVKTTLPDWPAEFTDDIRKGTLSETIVKGDEFLVERI